MKNKVRVRFAPSPTGHLHIGGLRTALFNYFFAKSCKGKFILRIEDTDRDRLVKEAVDQIISSLEWVGIKIDEGPHVGNGYGPYIQSERVKIYQAIADQLVKKGLAYFSYLSPAELEKLRKQAIYAKRPFVYRQSFEPQRQIKGGNYPIRFKVPPGETHWQDEIRGQFKIKNDLIDDFVILKADGFPTYNFANVVDDHLMKITHVIRGDEFIASTPKHVLLYKTLNYSLPKFAHLPVILGPDKTKLSKRHGAKAVLEYRDQGYLPDALVNFLTLLGWNDGTNQEIYSRKELESKFKLTQVQKSPAIFDQTRLNWMNGLYIRKLKVSKLANLIKPYLTNAGFKIENQNYLQKVVALDQERIKLLSDAPKQLDFFFVEPEIKPELLTAKDSKQEVKKWLILTADLVEKIGSSPAKLQPVLSTLAHKLKITNGQLFYPIRIAITGKTQAPGLFETISTLGKQKTLQRIKKAINLLEVN